MRGFAVVAKGRYFLAGALNVGALGNHWETLMRNSYTQVPTQALMTIKSLWVKLQRWELEIVSRLYGCLLRIGFHMFYNYTSKLNSTTTERRSKPRETQHNRNPTAEINFQIIALTWSCIPWVLVRGHPLTLCLCETRILGGWVQAGRSKLRHQWASDLQCHLVLGS